MLKGDLAACVPATMPYSNLAQCQDQIEKEPRSI